MPRSSAGKFLPSLKNQSSPYGIFRPPRGILSLQGMHEVIEFLLRYGYWVLFANVLLEQAGLPIPAIPTLLAMGALTGTGHFSLAADLALAVAACLAADTVWFHLGRTRGHRILNFLCRMSLEPDSCVSNTKNRFGRQGAYAVLFAKFVPGLSTVAAPMAGLTRMPLYRYLAVDLAGSLLWSGCYLAVGMLFRNQLELAIEWAGHAGRGLLLVIVLLFAAWLGWKYWKRWSFIHDLRVARVSPDELMRMMDAGVDVTVVDLRNALEFDYEGVKIPGSLWIDMERLEDHEHTIPREREVILYCS